MSRITDESTTDPTHEMKFTTHDAMQTQGLINELASSLATGFAGTSAPDVGREEHTECIHTPHRPWLYDVAPALKRRALLELRPIAEAWINHDGRRPRRSHRHLVGNNAYGLRIYRNQSRLHMHLDQSDTHVVSAILHVDHDKHR